jgi:hypothetical protein
MTMTMTTTIAPERPDTGEPHLPPQTQPAPDGFPRIDPPEPQPDPLPDRPPMPEPLTEPFPQI